jgi:hypothetical protein
MGGLLHGDEVATAYAGLCRRGCMTSDYTRSRSIIRSLWRDDPAAFPERPGARRSTALEGSGPLPCISALKSKNRATELRQLLARKAVQTTPGRPSKVCPVYIYGHPASVL